MKQVEKRKINKNLLRLIALFVTLLVITGVYLLVTLTDKGDGNGGSTPSLPEVDTALGESVYLNMPLAYSRLEEGEIDYIRIRNRDKDGKLRLFDLASVNGTFILSYSLDGSEEKMVQHMPGITGAEGDFDYASLYAIEANDGYGRIYLLTYLCSAIGTPYFNEKIPLPEDATEREEMLERFGLDSKSACSVSFTYEKSKDEIGGHIVTIGARALSGSGFYFMVDGRDFVYYTNSNYFEYAMKGAEEFINGRIIAEAYGNDGVLEPMLTTDFLQWAGKEHKQEGERITAGATVIAHGIEVIPRATEKEGYSLSDRVLLTFNPDELKAHSDYSRFEKMLTGRAVGKLDTPLYLTLLDEIGSASSHLIKFTDGSSTYSYRVTAVESVITDTEELRSLPVGESVEYDLIKITYTLSIDGKTVEGVQHAVLDLTSPLLPPGVADELRAIGVGEADSPVEFDVVYTEDNSVRASESLYITSITAIYSQTGELLGKVGEDSFVTFVYYEMINGVKSQDRSITVDLKSATDNQRWRELKDAIVGKKLGDGQNIKLYDMSYHYELMQGFAEYRVDEIEEFVTRELVVSFRYLANPSDKDPFFAESDYENTMDEHAGYEHLTMYGLDVAACKNVVNKLGGFGGENVSTAGGYVGEAVAVGLTHENMKLYGLYAYTVYFELPRGIYDRDDVDQTTTPDPDAPINYGWYDTLGFTLYISEEDNGYRYVGSDMYDVVARVPASDFSFLNYSFQELYARKNFMFMSISNAKEVVFDLNLKDYYGTYSFGMTEETWYVGQIENGQYKGSAVEFEGSRPVSRYYINIKSSEGSMETEYERIKREKGVSSLTVSAIYNELHNGGEEYLYPGSVDTQGVVQYKNLFNKILTTYYNDRLVTEEERALAMSREKLMGMRIQVVEDDGTVIAGYRAFDFYYIDGVRVLVVGYKTNSQGVPVGEKVCDFAISNYAFENIAMSVVGILNGEFLNMDGGYLSPLE